MDSGLVTLAESEARVIIRPLTPLEKAIVDQKIAILLLEEGEACAAFLAGVATTMALVCNAAESGRRKPKGLRSDLEVCLAQIKLNALQKESVPTILRGLDTCLKIAPSLPTGAITKAWNKMR